jgi:hypothetical protein
VRAVLGVAHGFHEGCDHRFGAEGGELDDQVADREGDGDANGGDGAAGGLEKDFPENAERGNQEIARGIDGEGFKGNRLWN